MRLRSEEVEDVSTEGRAWKFGDDVNTDLIIPGKYLDDYDPAHLASHAMEGADRDFSKLVRQGDVIVAGRNFGCGSSREQAVIALKHSGVEAVVAKSFARIFYRNAVNLGLAVAVSSEACEMIKAGEMVQLDHMNGTLTRISDGRQAHLDPMPDHVRAILDAGGLVPFVKRRLSDQRGKRQKE